MSPITGYRSAASSSSLTTVEERRSPVQAPLLGAEDYRSLDEVAMYLNEGGVEYLNPIVGVDFTRSNTWNGQKSFNGHSLHAIGHTPNPYEQVIRIFGETSSKFYKDDIPIQCFGFGDESTRDKDVFGFNLNERPCHGYREVLDRYKELVSHLKLAGPTSFAPLIEMATTLVVRSGWKHHVLLIIADGQEAVRIDNESGQVTVQDKKTIDAVASASHFPLSIILVGVGDYTWDMMHAFQAFNNFQFVNFSEIMSRETAKSRNEAAFAFEVFSKIPLQFKEAMELGISGRNSVSPNRAPQAPPDKEDLLPPSHVLEFDGADLDATTYTFSYQHCPICLTNLLIDMAFGCGHMTCSDCGPKFEQCPICRSSVTTRITLHQQDVCSVCLGDTKDMALNCGHLTCCACGPGLELCRICDNPITVRIKLY